MRKIWSLTLCSLPIGLAAIVAASPAVAAPEFSADMVQSGADGQASVGKMAVGDRRMRTEMVHQGQKVIRITDEKRGVEWILFPERKNYLERQLTAPGGQPPARPSADDPCAGMPNLTCTKIREEPVAGRTAVVWEIVAKQQGKEMKGTQWIDKERGPSFMLRQELPTDQTMERSLVGSDTVGGRQTEQWKISMTRPDGETMSTVEWYDPELEIAIKQEFPGGMVSEISNIRVGQQPDHLFAIPAGYERISTPQGMPEQPPQQ